MEGVPLSAQLEASLVSASATIGLPRLDVILPTFNNPQYLYPCLSSLIATKGAGFGYPLRIIVVNNGHPDVVQDDPETGIEVIQAGKNLGWEGGLKAGLERSTSEFVVFSNDDIYIPSASFHWARMLLTPFRRANVAAVGPCSNVVMGTQNIFASAFPGHCTVPYLIGFFVVIRRAALDAIGGIDATLPGGDDLDLGIRFRQAGYCLINRRDVFVFHHGFKTGERVYGGPGQPGGWNSHDMQERTDNALIRKHGFRAWWSLYNQPPERVDMPSVDYEGDSIRQWISGDRVLELGCGAQKTIPGAIGVDLVPAGELTYRREASAANVVADVFSGLPFEDESADTIVARHIFEHAVAPVEVLQSWHRVLKPGGRLIVAAPNEDIAPGIPMDITHKHAWNPDGFRTLAELCGYRQVAYTPNSGNGISFVTVLERT